jgi:hypothetical protein
MYITRKNTNEFFFNENSAKLSYLESLCHSGVNWVLSKRLNLQKLQITACFNTYFVISKCVTAASI